jgi:hypothetical protein
MKTIKNTLLLLAFATATLFTSCSKSDSAAATTTTPAAADGFTWTENGGTTVMTGYTPYFVTQGHSLFVQNATGGVLFEFNFNSLAPATNVLGGITFNPGAVFYVDYQFVGVTNINKFVPTSGTCIIASNANGKISGTFTASGSTGTISSIKGTFNNITVQP